MSELTRDTDIQKLTAVIGYISNIKKAFALNDIENANNLKADEITQAACTQFITNIFEAKKRLREKTSEKLALFNKFKLSGTRNIASHVYESLDFGIVYGICKQLINSSVLSELYAVLADLEQLEIGEQKDDIG